jgi:hypothetical protein
VEWKLDWGLTDADRPLGPRLLNCCGTTVVHGNIIAALLQRIRAVSQRTLVRIQICSTLSHFLRRLFLTLARMSNRLLRKKRSAEESGESHDELENEEHRTRKAK